MSDNEVDREDTQDSEVEFNFRNAEARNQADQNNDDDLESVSSDSESSDGHQEAAVNASAHAEAPASNGGLTRELLKNITGVVKDVVAQELRQLRNRSRMSPERNRRDNYREEVPYRRNYSQCEDGRNANFNSNIRQNRERGERMNEARSMGGPFDARYDYQDSYRPRAMNHVKIQPFSGQEDWQVWVSRFETLAMRYGWTEDEKLDQLLPRLDGLAGQFVFTQLPTSILANYRELLKELNCRFRKVETSRAYAVKFSNRNQRPGETAEDYAADLKFLYDKAHGYRDRVTRDEDLVRRFLDGLRDEEARFEIEFHKEPSTIDEAVFHVVHFVQTRSRGDYERRNNRGARRTIADKVENINNERDTYSNHASGRNKRNLDELDTYEDLPGSSTRSPHDQDCSKDNAMQMMLKQLEDRLEKRFEKIEASMNEPSKRPRKPEVVCFNCQRTGHYARECPDRNTNGMGGRERPQNFSLKKEQSLNFKGPSLGARGGSSNRRN